MNKVQEGIDEGLVHVDDVVLLFEDHGVRGFDSSAVVRVNGASIIEDIVDFGGERIVVDGICLTAGIVRLEGGVDGSIKEVHFLGDGRFVRLGTFAHVLEQIVENKEGGCAQTRIRQFGEGKAHGSSRGF